MSLPTALKTLVAIAVALIPIFTFFEKARNLAADAYRWVFRPQLEMYFDRTRTYDVASDLAVGGIGGMFAHVLVVNHGRKTASKCRGLLSEVHAETSHGVFEPAPGFKNPVELHWAHEATNCFAKDIPPNELTRLDVCYAHDGYTILHFFCEKLPRGVQTDFPPGRYKIRIRVRSEDGATCSRRFLVGFDGNFRSVYMIQLAD